MNRSSYSGRIVALIQARTSSSRLPQKSISPLCGIPLILHVIARVKQVAAVDEIVVATSNDPSDDRLACMVTDAGYTVFRGDLLNVQKRMYEAACSAHADILIRVTADNPFIEPILIDQMIAQWKSRPVDYIGWKACVVGIGTELFTMSSFRKVLSLSKTEYDHEHVTPPYYQQQEQFSVLFMEAPQELVQPDLQLTIDTPQDFERMEQLYTQFQKNGTVSVAEIVASHRKKEFRK